MKPFVIDTHMHTIASGHAYGTVMEMARAAADTGLSLIAITEHAPSIPGTCSEIYFRNFKVIDKELFGVEILMGTELNILDYNGSVDMSERVLKKLPVVIASLHDLVIPSGTKQENTRALLKVMENPYVTTIGHPDDGRYPTDFEEMVKGAKEYHKLIEINNSSLKPCSRVNSRENMKEIMKWCLKYDQPIIVNTDSHFPTHVGKFDQARELIEEIAFPEELIVNTDLKEFKKYLNKTLL